MSLALEELGITKEDLIDRVIERLIERLDTEDEFFTTLSDRARDLVHETLSNKINAAVDARLGDEMTTILAEKIVPVNAWGERAGEETTLMDAFRSKAREFWDVSVDKDGKPTRWGGIPRHEHIMQKVLKDEFAKAVRDNATEIVTAFKAAVKGNISSMVNEHIEKLIPSRR